MSPTAILVLTIVAALGCERPAANAPTAKPSGSSTAAEQPEVTPEARASRTRRVRDDAVEDIRRSGWVGDEQVLAALRQVPRERFAPDGSAIAAYDERAVSLGHGAVMPPAAVAGRMIEALELKGDQRVLEVGAGSGYEAALLSLLAHEVHATESNQELGTQAAERLRRLGYLNVTVHVAEDRAGVPEAAPFDRILLISAPAEDPPILLGQLTEGGVLVAPKGEHPGVWRLTRYRRLEGAIQVEDLGPMSFTPPPTRREEEEKDLKR